MVPCEEPSGPYLEAIQRAFQFAHELGRGCGPAEFLVGISEGRGPAAVALDPGQGRSLRAVAAAADGTARPGGGYLHMQAQGAARSLAAALGQPAGAEHLLIALLDQGTPEVARTLSRAGLDPAVVRQAVLAAIGTPADQPPIPMPALAPAGTMDRPPLPVTDLDAQAWTVLRWRQDHLPLSRLRRDSDRQALAHLERAAAWRQPPDQSAGPLVPAPDHPALPRVSAALASRWPAVRPPGCPRWRAKRVKALTVRPEHPKGT